MDPGDHGCVIYSADSELIGIVAAYIHEGLRAGERCWYAASSMSELAHVRAALQATYGDVTEAEVQGSLRLITADEMYLAGGVFEPERLLRDFSHAIPAAVHDGFPALRIAGEMSWILQRKPGTDRVMEYEGCVEMMLRASAALALCFYNRRLIPAELLDDALAKHPLAGVDGEPRPNAFYRPKVIADLRRPHAEDLCWKLKHLQRNGNGH